MTVYSSLNFISAPCFHVRVRLAWLRNVLSCRERHDRLHSEPFVRLHQDDRRFLALPALPPKPASAIAVEFLSLWLRDRARRQEFLHRLALSFSRLQDRT